VAVVSDRSIANYAYNAGFRGNALVIAIAIAIAESGGNTMAYNPETAAGTTAGMGSYGLWQIYRKAHPQYTAQYLYNPANNAKAAWSISKQGTYWHPWTTWTRGTYKTKLPRARIAASSTTGSKDTGGKPPPIGTGVHPRWEPAWLHYMVLWIHNPSIKMRIRRDYKWDGEGGVDLPSKQGTPVYALADGPLLGAGTYAMPGVKTDYGVVAQRIVVPGHGTQDIYYQHINIASNIRFCKNNRCNNQFIKKGQQVGTTAGFAEVEVGFNPTWGGIWGDPNKRPGPWPDDPRPMIKALMDAGPPGTPSTSSIDPSQPGTPGDTTGTSALAAFFTGFSITAPPTFVPVMDQVHETLIATPGFYGISLALYEAEHFPGWIDLTQKEEAETLIGKIPIPDIIGEVRSVGATISDNFLAFAIRSGLVTLGLILLIMLIVKAASPVAAPVLKIAALAA